MTYTNTWELRNRPTPIRPGGVYESTWRRRRIVYNYQLLQAKSGKGMYTMGFGMQKEAADITMRVPSALRDDLNDLKVKLRVTTPHEAIRKLIDYRDKAERERNDTKAYQEQHMIEVGKADKAEFLKLKEELGLRTDAGVLEFLIYAYHANLQMPLGAFEMYLRLKKEGK